MPVCYHTQIRLSNVTNSKQIYFVICMLQLELREFKHNVFACELLVDP